MNSPTDPRIDQFIKDLRVNATLEPGVACSSGTYVTATGTSPHNLGGGPHHPRPHRLRARRSEPRFHVPVDRS